MSGGRIRVVVADDHGLFRRGVVEMLSFAGDVEVVWEAADHDGAVELASERRPDVVLLDLEMPGMGADEAIRRVGGGVVKELGREYFIVSMYLLLRHLRVLYVFGEAESALFRDFVYDFHSRWQDRGNKNSDVLLFKDKRQQSAAEILERHQILRQLFFEYAAQRGHEIKEKDTKRAFDESERILLYRVCDGLCQECDREGKPKSECLVPWHEFEADHVVPHSKGGQTVLDNAELLCRTHNRKKGAAVGATA